MLTSVAAGMDRILCLPLCQMGLPRPCMVQKEGSCQVVLLRPYKAWGGNRMSGVVTEPIDCTHRIPRCRDRLAAGADATVEERKSCMTCLYVRKYYWGKRGRTLVVLCALRKCINACRGRRRCGAFRLCFISSGSFTSLSRMPAAATK